MNIFDEIPILDPDSENFENELEFEMLATGGSSVYRNDRERPYNGQSWTDDGERGKTEVKGLTMRDLRDCLIKAMFHASPPSQEYWDNFTKCWDFFDSEEDQWKPTQYLIDCINQGKFIEQKIKLGTWRTQDVYKLNWEEIDPIAICQNFTCEIERMMGIFPNLPKNIKNKL